MVIFMGNILWWWEIDFRTEVKAEDNIEVVIGREKTYFFDPETLPARV